MAEAQADVNETVAGIFEIRVSGIGQRELIWSANWHYFAEILLLKNVK